MVNDTEPRYRLVDADGNVVGSLYTENDGTLKLQEGTSGSDNEVSVATDGTFKAPSVSAEDTTIDDGSDFRAEWTGPNLELIKDTLNGDLRMAPHVGGRGYTFSDPHDEGFLLSIKDTVPSTPWLVGRYRFEGTNDSGSGLPYGYFSGTALTRTAGSEDGKMTATVRREGDEVDPQAWDPTNMKYQPYPMWQMEKNAGSTGSVTFTDRKIQIRQNSASSSADFSRAFDNLVEFDPSLLAGVRIDLSNITLGDDANARLYFVLTDSPDSRDNSGDELMGAVIYGSGNDRAITKTGGATSTTDDGSVSSSYADGLNNIEIEYDGSSVTVTTDDGSTETVVSDGGEYPSGDLYLKIEGVDLDTGAARSADFDVDKLTRKTAERS